MQSRDIAWDLWATEQRSPSADHECSTLMPLSTLFQLYRGGQFNAILNYQRVIGGIAYHHFS